MKFLTNITLFSFAFLLVQCGSTTQPENQGQSNNLGAIMEVTTFTIGSDHSSLRFRQLDQEVEQNFTSKQPGFIKRQSGLNEKGQYAVVVFWESIEDADASMAKFMKDPSVSEYAQMINGQSMNMERFQMDTPLENHDSQFVELMKFNLNKGTDLAAFNKLNQQVETDYTGTRKGFLQRLTGVNEAGLQVVAVYWTNKSDSDASLDGFMNNATAKKFMAKMDQSSLFFGRYKNLSMELTKKEKAVALLNSFNNGDQTPISFINPNDYVQHNLSVGDGLQGFGEVMQHAPPEGFKANVIRAFEDGDFVFTHTVYDFFGPKIGFDIFRFENDLIVEHWDNLIEVQEQNPSGHTQTDGYVDITDKEKTAQNKEHVRMFIEDILLNHNNDKITDYINPNEYIQHNPAVADGLEGFGEAMKYFAEKGLVMAYNELHMILGEGNFVLTVSEGTFGTGEPTAFYDLFRVQDGLIVEHWDVISPIPPKADWKNENGKF